MSKVQVNFTTIIHNSDYIVRDHRVHGVRIMPGVTFFDIILRALEENGIKASSVTFKNVLFMEPVATTERWDKEIRVTFTESDDFWRITAESRKVVDGCAIDNEYHENLQCTMHNVKEQKQIKIDIDSLKNNALAVFDMDKAYAFARKMDIKHYEFMKSLGKVYDYGEGLLAELYLSGLSEKYCDNFYLHPAFLDAATLVPGLQEFYDRPDKLLKPFIPLCFEEFSAYNISGNRCYIYVSKDSVKLIDSGDLLYADLQIFDENGIMTASLKRMGSKQIRSENLIKSLENSNNQNILAEDEKSNFHVKQMLQEIIAGFLNCASSSVDISKGFYELGLDSGQLLQIVEILEHNVHKPLYPTLLFEYETIEKLTIYMEENYEFAFTESKTAMDVKDDNKTDLSENDLCRMVGELLQKDCDSVAIEDSFYELGLDSRQLLDLTSKIESAVNRQLYPTLLFEYSNIRALAGYLKENISSLDVADKEMKKVPINNEKSLVYVKPVWLQRETSNNNDRKENVLIFEEEDFVSNHIKKSYATEGKRVLSVRRANNFSYEHEQIFMDFQTEDHYKELFDTLREMGIMPDCVIFASADFSDWKAELSDVAPYYAIHSYHFFCKALCLNRVKKEIRIIYCYPIINNIEQPQYAALSGFSNSLSIENEKLVSIIMGIHANSDTEYHDIRNQAVSEVLSQRTKKNEEIRYKDGKQFVRRLAKAGYGSRKQGVSQIKSKGVYIITGGMGGVGYLFAEYLTCSYNAVVILSGRSGLDEIKQEKLDRLKMNGAQVSYIRADISKKEEVEHLITTVLDRYKVISGIIHAAGIVRDSLLENKSVEDMDAVLEAKVKGTINLEMAVRNYELDFLVMFSSSASVTGNMGQCDYAYANSFMDFYVEYSNASQKNTYPGRKIISINWPLWENGGLMVDALSQKKFADRVGMYPLGTENGMEAFEHILEGDSGQVLVIEGQEEKILDALEIEEINEGIEFSPETVNNKDIAIIGMSGKYPMAENVEEFWENLKSGRDCICEIPKSRWDYEEFYNREESDSNCKWGGFINDVDKFDPLFFQISPKEAVTIDPQERLFLEIGWKAIEDAGYTRETLKKTKVGVFLGVMNGQYELLKSQNERELTTAVHASVANRFSYFMNFTGPSIAVDSMCSSSLTSIHMACSSIRNGECVVAVAGGVNVILHPDKYNFLGARKFTSTFGRCRSFSEGGDGYVPGEGIGAVILKPLNLAVKDKDQIYAVIKGSAINHGGKTGGYSVPSPAAQAEVISEALKDADISSREISYIEAHGTGTALGDPIEILGLNKAFGNFNQEKQYCSIGSVKSNIGHLESAAGISGITKILLQMKYRKLVPSIHAQEINHDINFEETPLYLQKVYEDWDRPLLDGNRECLRTAGISSFGAGGTNVHIILQEYEQKYLKQQENKSPWYIIVLSARNKERLWEYAESLRNFAAGCNQGKQQRLHMVHLAYTLQTGREEMEERLAVLAEDFRDLAGKLTVFLEGENETKHIFTGNRKKNKDVYGSIINAERSQYSVEEKELCMLANRWIAGEKINWNSCYTEDLPLKVSLPTYPFEMERCWITKDGALYQNVDNGRISKGNKIHPLLDENRCNMNILKYVSKYSNQNSFLKDHVIRGENLMPGAVYLEMARAAGQEAGETPVCRLTDIVWEKGFVGKESDQFMQIVLEYKQAFINFQISSEVNCIRNIHASGRMEFGVYQDTAETLNLENLKNRFYVCENEASIYEGFLKSGYKYGSSFRTMKYFWPGSGEALSYIVLPDTCGSEAADYILHPSMLDGAMQTAGALVKNDNNEKEYLPFAVESLDIMGPLGDKCYVHAVQAKKADQVDGILKFYINIYDENGIMKAKITGFSVKEVSAAKNKAFSWVLIKKKLLEAPLLAEKKNKGNFLVFDKNRQLTNQLSKKIQGNIVLVTPGTEYKKTGHNEYMVKPGEQQDFKLLFQDLSQRSLAVDEILYLWTAGEVPPEMDRIDDCLTNGVLSLFCLVKERMLDRNNKKVGITYIFHSESAWTVPFYKAAGAFGKSVEKENPNIFFKTVEINGTNCGIEISDIIRKEVLSHDDEVLYQDNMRYVTKLSEVSGTDKIAEGVPDSINNDGVYMITGGAGGIGLLFARYLSQRVKTVILTGRSDLTEEISKKISKIEKCANQVVYMKADVSKKEEAVRLVSDVKKDFGSINGVIHCAGITKDSLILNKTIQEFKDVMSPKVYGLLYLAGVLEPEKLDFFVTFSSVSAVFGNVGQCDYAYANSFMDHFMHQCHKENKYKRCFSINWPFWKDGGMSIPRQYEEKLNDMYGIVSLSTGVGIRAFEKILSMQDSQMIVLEGEERKIRETLLKDHETDKARTGMQKTVNVSDDEAIWEQMAKYLKKALAEITGLSQYRISLDEEMEQYGIDSVMIMDFTRNLEGFLGNLPKTLFFQYQTLHELTDYFVKNYRDKLTKKFYDGKTAEVKPIVFKQERQPEVKKNLSNEYKEIKQAETNKISDIAIIGVSGRYPEADNLDEFWKNMLDGRDCIVEIPPERWDYRTYYDPDKNKKGISYSKWGGFIKDVDKFDPKFFNISEGEARMLDPQERIFMETAWHTIEDAGYTRQKLSKEEVGVFVGAMYAHYQIFGAEETLRGNTASPGSSFSSIANRVSYFMNFHGPSIAVDTMCSSSLTSIHMACESIRNGECSVALAGGVNITIHPSKYLMICRSNFASSDGRCRSFGSGGDGYVPGEGVGAVLLKPLAQAVADGDNIYAVMKASGINHGGKTNGYTVPNPNYQSALILKVLNKAGIDPRTISYVEAHGTGTALGDPIEIMALTKAYSEYTADRGYCSIGSIKSNIGHLESAAGIAGLTKVLLQMKYKTLIPSIHCEKLNPNIDFLNSPFYVQRDVSGWSKPVIERDGKRELCPRRASVSAFGAGGANAYILLEEYEAPIAEAERSEKQQIVVLSAKDVSNLIDMAKNLMDFISAKHHKKDHILNREENCCRVRQFIVRSVVEILDITQEDIDISDCLLGCGFDTVKYYLLLEKIKYEYKLPELPLTSISMQDTFEKMAQLLAAEYEAVFNVCHNSVSNGTDAGTELYLEDIAYTLQTGREKMGKRVAFIAADMNEMYDKLEHFFKGGQDDSIFTNINSENTAEYSSLIEGEDGEAFVSHIISCNKLDKIAKLWVMGAKIQWKNVHKDGEPKHISLPCYSFTKKRFWLKTTDIKVNKEEENGYDIIHFTNYWEESELAETSKIESTDNNILVFDTDSDFISRLREETQNPVILVTPGKGYKKVNDGYFEVSPSNLKDYRKLFEELTRENMSLDGIIHLWGKRGMCDGLSYENLIENSILSLQNCVQALWTDTHHTRSTKIKLLYMFKEKQSECEPLYGAASGFLRTLVQENPIFSCKILKTNTNLHARQVWMEYLECNDIVKSVSIKYKKRYVKNIKKIPYSSVQKESLPLYDGGVYIITGGLGGLGFIISRYIVSKVKAKLLLIGRSEEDEVKKRKLKELNSAGSEAAYYQLDISVKEDVNRLKEIADEQYGEVNGIVHCAGVFHNNFIMKKTQESIRQVISPKTLGTMYLDEVFQGARMDFFIMFSSLAGAVGKVGQSDYAYANCFMDCFACYREVQRAAHKRYGITISINWPHWDADGMNISTQERDMLAEEYGMQPLTDEMGIRALESTFEIGQPQCIVLYGDKKKLENIFEENKAEDESDVIYDEALDETSLRDKTEDMLKQLIGAEIEQSVDEFDDTVSFEEYGVDSVTVNHFNAGLEKKIGKVSKTLLYECKNVKELTGYMLENYANQLMHLFSFHAKSKIKRTQVSTDFSSAPAQNNSVIREVKSQEEGDIAVIGAAGKYPGSDNLEEFWENLKEGKDLIDEIPEDRWDFKKYFDADTVHVKQGKSYCKWGGFINNAYCFDTLFFNISPREAEMMDPQERQFLETAWSAFEDAGYNKKKLAEKTGSEYGTNVGVFVGVTSNTYMLNGPEEWAKNNRIIPQSMSFNIANRVSYFMDLSGPSMPVDTACSSSLAAIHLACESLKNGECKMALAGGVNLYLHPYKYVSMSQIKMLSPTGRCHAFGSEGDGFVPGEGVGALILKPLKEAIKDGDNIQGIIRASAINHGGHANGYTVPNPNAQEKLIEQTLRKAQIDASTISFIEAHGTGTALGDPIEITGLTKAFRKYTTKNNYCAISSVKSNIGHSEGAAGIAGITKILLQLKHKKLVPSIHCETTNSNIDFENSPFYLQKKYSEWGPSPDDGNGEPRRAGISSFGAGGTNVHIIMEEYIKTNQKYKTAASEYLIPLSAKSGEALKTRADSLLGFVRGQESSLLEDIAYTLCTGREAMECRTAFIVRDKVELENYLNQYISDVSRTERANDKSSIKRSKEREKISEEMIQRALNSNDLPVLLEYWTIGKNVDFGVLYSQERCGKVIQLPTYPFEDECYKFEHLEERKETEQESVCEDNILLEILENLKNGYLNIVEADKLIEEKLYAGENTKQGSAS